MRKWFSAQELVGLPGLPASVSGLIRLAKREGWEAQLRLGRGGGREYSFAMLPAETQAALVARMVQAEQPAEAPKPTAPHTLISPQRDGISTSRLTDDQRDVMSARVSIIREVERMSQMVSQQRAILTLVGLARDGQLSPYLAERVERANDRKTADRTLSERTIKRWLADFRKHGEIALAPIRRKPDMTLPVWAPMFLKHYQRPQKPSAEAAYADFKAEYPGAPSIHAVRRMLAKMTPQARERGRLGAHAGKAIRAFHRRTYDMLWPNDIWIADGHTFDAEVMNPLTGQIFRPEVTMVIDWGTRRIVGFSVNLAESTIATLDTLRDGVSRVGMYKVLYVDNGSGFDNAVVYEVNDRLDVSAVRHVEKNHGNAKSERARGQRAVSAEDYAMLPRLLNEGGPLIDAGLSRTTSSPLVRRELTVDGVTYVGVFEVRKGRRMLVLQTFYIREGK